MGVYSLKEGAKWGMLLGLAFGAHIPKDIFRIVFIQGHWMEQTIF